MTLRLNSSRPLRKGDIIRKSTAIYRRLLHLRVRGGDACSHCNIDRAIPAKLNENRYKNSIQESTSSQFCCQLFINMVFEHPERFSVSICRLIFAHERLIQQVNQERISTAPSIACHLFSPPSFSETAKMNAEWPPLLMRVYPRSHR